MMGMGGRLACWSPLATGPVDGATDSCRSGIGGLGSPQSAGAVSLSPGAMVGAGLWLELDLVIGFTVGLGLGSLMGQVTSGRSRQWRQASAALIRRPRRRRRQRRRSVRPALADYGDIIVHLIRITTTIICRTSALVLRVEGQAMHGAWHRSDFFGGQKRAGARVDQNDSGRIEVTGVRVRVFRARGERVPSAAERIGHLADQPDSRQPCQDLERC